LITLGEADTVVHPDITAGFACRACRAGTSVALRLYPGVDHTNIGYDSADDVAAWIADRFAGRPAQSECNRLP